jgi:hypothetical protein
MLSTTRRRIVVYLVITVLPLSALALYLAVDERAEDEARARIEEKAIVHEVRTDLDRLFHLSRSLVAGIGDQESDARICGTLDAMALRRTRAAADRGINLFRGYAGGG